MFWATFRYVRCTVYIFYQGYDSQNFCTRGIALLQANIRLWLFITWGRVCSYFWCQSFTLPKAFKQINSWKYSSWLFWAKWSFKEYKVFTKPPKNIDIYLRTCLLWKSNRNWNKSSKSTSKKLLPSVKFIPLIVQENLPNRRLPQQFRRKKY